MRRTQGIVTVTAIGLCLATAALAQGGPGGKEPPKMTPQQEAEMKAWADAATPGAAHKALASQVGTYDLKVKSWLEPGAPPMEETGTAKRSMTLGGRVLVEEYSGTMMGQPMTGHGMRGHDNVTGKEWATWTDTMITGLMVSEGTCDWAKNTCSFTGTMNDPIKKAPSKVRMMSRWTNPTTEVFEMYGAGPDGKEMKMMEITYSKK